MKQLLTMLLAVSATVALAGMNNLVLTFSSTGPDVYKDGTTVRDREYYALVWTPDGAEFAGINADGSAVAPSKVAIAAPVATGGRCPPVMYQIDEDYLKANFPGGSWGVYLLDTRVFAVDGEGVVQQDAQGKAIVTGSNLKAVKGYGAVAAELGGTALASASAASSVAVGLASLAEVKIIDIAFEGDNVLLTVQGASAGMFELSAGNQPDALSPDGKSRSSVEETAIIVRPKQAGGEFFQVNRK